MSDEYKKRYIIMVPSSPSLMKVRDTTVGSQRTDQGWEVKRTNTDLPSTTTETIIHPIGQNILLINQNKEVQTKPLVNPNRDDDARSCPGTAAHASGTCQLLPSPFVAASEIANMTKKNNRRKQTETRKTSKQYTRQGIALYRKVLISLLTTRVKLFAFTR